MKFSAQKKDTPSKNRQKNPFGFTLVELIVVISILVILGTIAFLSVSSYISSARDGKRISNVTQIANGFDIAVVTSRAVNTSKTSTGMNISIVGGSLTMTGYYGVINDPLLQSLKVSGKDITVYDWFQEYRYGYFPSEKKYQVFATLENSENARSAFVDQAFAASCGGYVFLKGNFTSTGGFNNLVVDGATWNGRSAVNGIETFSGSETIAIGQCIALVPAVSQPADGQCGGSSGGSFTTTPAINLCAVGSPTAVTDNGIGSTYTWGCSGVNGGASTSANSCTANHVPTTCTFDVSKFDNCAF